MVDNAGAAGAAPRGAASNGPTLAEGVMFAYQVLITLLLWSESLMLSAGGACNRKPACMCFLLPVYHLAG